MIIIIDLGYGQIGTEGYIVLSLHMLVYTLYTRESIMVYKVPFVFSSLFLTSHAVCQLYYILCRLTFNVRCLFLLAYVLLPLYTF